MRRLILALAAALAMASPALAEPTTVTIRALSRDAKFIGTGVGGARVRLTDAATGVLLAEGVTTGGTGDTDRIVVKPRARGERLSAEGDAAFTAVIDIDRPTMVKLEAAGPLHHRGAEITVTSMALILPGQPVVGDGWVVEFPGLIVEPSFDRSTPGEIGIVAKVTLMCGCPVTPGGLWDADHFRVEAWLAVGDAPPRPIPLAYAGEASTFQVTIPSPGKAWSLTVTAIDERSGNTGSANVAYRAD